MRLRTEALTFRVVAGRFARMSDETNKQLSGVGIFFLFVFLLAQALGLLVMVAGRWEPPVAGAKMSAKEIAEQVSAARTETDAKMKDADAKMKDADAKGRDAYAKMTDAFAKAKDAEARKKDAEAKKSEADAETDSTAKKKKEQAASDAAVAAKSAAEAATAADTAAKTADTAATTAGAAATTAGTGATKAAAAAYIAIKAQEESAAVAKQKEQSLFIIVLLAGALGGALHALNSLVGFLGNKQFEGNWGWWYFVRAPIGAGLAAAVFVAVRAGFMTSSVSNNDLNYFGFVALALLTGFFNRNATAKLIKVAEALFTAAPPEGGPLKPAIAITKLTPAATPPLTTPQAVEITGSGFANDAVVTVDGKPLAATDVTFVSATTLKVTLPAALLSAKGIRRIRVTRPGPPALESAPADFEVKDAAAPSPGGNVNPQKPAIVITNLNPKAVSLPLAAAFQEIDVAGTGFTDDVRVKLDGTPLARENVQFVSAVGLKLKLPAALLGAKGIRKIQVERSGANAATSTTADLEITGP
jgi:hypothetical protein